MRTERSYEVSSTCAACTPCSPSRDSYERNSVPCPTAEAACSSSTVRGRAGSSISRQPSAIAPEVTMATSSPDACRSATWPQTLSSTLPRTSPRSSATIDDPSFTTTVIGGSGYGPAATQPGSSSNSSSPMRTSSPGSNPARSSAAITPISRRRCSR